MGKWVGSEAFAKCWNGGGAQEEGKLRQHAAELWGAVMRGNGPRVKLDGIYVGALRSSR